MHHELKIERPFYDAVRSGKKTFEVRFNDRGYQAGDTVVFTPLTELRYNDFSLPKLEAEIGYVLAYKMEEGYVAFSLLNINEQPCK